MKNWKLSQAARGCFLPGLGLFFNWLVAVFYLVGAVFYLAWGWVEG
jgi:hypothetical protein